MISSELYRARAQNVIPDCPAIRPESFNTTLSRDNLKEILSRFTMMERRLIFFALLTREHIVLAAGTTYTDLRQRSQNNERLRKAMAIAKRTPRRLASAQVFWIGGEQWTTTPILDFGSKFHRVTKMHWVVFAELFELYLKKPKSQA